MSRLLVESLSISFGGLRALSDVSFTVEPGQIFAIIGPNGAGKSTLFNLISRIYRPTSGAIAFGSHDLLKVAAHRTVSLGIARTFQNLELFENSTVLENLLIGQHCRIRRNILREMIFPSSLRREERARRAKIEDVIDLLDIGHLRYERIRDLPYGARKNVEIARALCTEPKLLLLDEPASGLNREETDDLAFWLEDIRKELDVTIVMVEHDMGLVNRLADQVLALGNGRKLALGSPDQVRSDPAVQEAYLGGAA